MTVVKWLAWIEVYGFRDSPLDDKPPGDMVVIPKWMVINATK